MKALHNRCTNILLHENIKFLQGKLGDHTVEGALRKICHDCRNLLKNYKER